MKIYGREPRFSDESDWLSFTLTDAASSEAVEMLNRRHVALVHSPDPDDLNLTIGGDVVHLFVTPKTRTAILRWLSLK